MREAQKWNMNESGWSGPAPADQSDNTALNWCQNSRQTYRVKRQIDRKQERQTEGTVV